MYFCYCIYSFVCQLDIKENDDDDDDENNEHLNTYVERGDDVHFVKLKKGLT